LKELELKEREIADKNELDLKEKELAIQKEMDFKEKELQMQLKLKEFELKAKMTPVSSKETTTSPTNENFDFIRHVKLVPPFQEHEVDNFFFTFRESCYKSALVIRGTSHVAAKCVNWEGL